MKMPTPEEVFEYDCTRTALRDALDDLRYHMMRGARVSKVRRAQASAVVREIEASGWIVDRLDDVPGWSRLHWREPES